jgi:Crp-like helix-turn-helix domain
VIKGCYQAYDVSGQFIATPFDWGVALGEVYAHVQRTTTRKSGVARVSESMNGVVPLAQEFLALMLGTRRASVTEAAGILQKAGLINYKRGAVRILSRSGLEGATCECYGIVAKQIKGGRQKRTNPSEPTCPAQARSNYQKVV